MAAGWHAVFFPFPAQGHVAPALRLAKLLHVLGGVRITFVHTERNLRRLIRSGGPATVAGAPGFRFVTVPDGLPPPLSDEDEDDHSPQHIAALLLSLEASVPRLRNHLDDAATDGEQLSNGYLTNTEIDWMPGMPENMRLRDMPSFIRTTDPDDAVLRAVVSTMDSYHPAVLSAVILNTFDELEGKVVAAMSDVLVPHIYTVGPLPLLSESASAGGSGGAASLLKEDKGCLEWLGSKRPGSVVYANFGSIAVLTSQQLVEFAWGLANSGYDFLAVIRNDQAKKSTAAALPPEFVTRGRGETTKERRGYVASWCPQGEVLRHEAVGMFLTHCGWNSMLESIASGVPMLCWPVGGDQQTNCRFACTEWGVGMELAGDGAVLRDQVEAQVKEVMGGERGREMRRRAAEWKVSAAAAALPLPDCGGTSWVNFNKLVNQVFSPRKDAHWQN
ncbi:unnamed protein product [Miscanthus lutarioriparius]|uniref:Glycosyltransferase n=1 Tax=Miscanthus lutarioriparius TaxID=422564 RepID=A0A811QFX3_9POAL|nr:unnamed protein product [Miscanthus lutarioriparius]